MINVHFSRREWLIALLLLVVVLLARLPSIPLPLDNDSGSIAYSARLIIQGEPLYGTHHPTHHLPGAYYTYAAIFALFGDSAQAIKWALIPWVWLNALVLYMIGRRLSGWAVGGIAAFFFIILTSMTNLGGELAEIELFANLPLSLIILIGVYLLQKREHSNLWYILLGGLGALCFLYKVVYLSSLGALGLVLLFDTLFAPQLVQRRAAWANLLLRGLAVLAGAVLVLAPVAVYFAVVGVWPRLWLVFQMGSGYVGQNNPNPFGFIFLIPLILIARVNPIFFVLGLFGIGRITLGMPKKMPADWARGEQQLLLLIWTATSILTAGFSRFAFSHYGLLMVPPFALLVGLEIDHWMSLTQDKSPQTRPMVHWAPLLVLGLLALACSLYYSRDYLGGYINYRLGRLTLSEFVRADTQQGISIVEAMQVADYIRQNSSKQDRILTWTDQAQICYLANRRSSADILWPAYVSMLGQPERVLQARPRYVVVGPQLQKDAPLPDWLQQELNSSYRLVYVQPANNVYERITP